MAYSKKKNKKRSASKYKYGSKMKNTYQTGNTMQGSYLNSPFSGGFDESYTGGEGYLGDPFSGNTGTVDQEALASDIGDVVDTGLGIAQGVVDMSAKEKAGENVNVEDYVDIGQNAIATYLGPWASLFHGISEGGQSIAEQTNPEEAWISERLFEPHTWITGNENSLFSALGWTGEGATEKREKELRMASAKYGGNINTNNYQDNFYTTQNLANMENNSFNFANGGNMFNNDGFGNNNMNQIPVNEFREGGTHEENPLGGIPQGIGPNGAPNLVEEGELKIPDPRDPSGNSSFIVSAQKDMKITKAIAKKHGLPKNLIGKTVLEAANAVLRESKDGLFAREDDKVKENSINQDLISFINAHEELSAIKEAKENAKFQEKLENLAQEHPEQMDAMMQPSQEAASQGMPMGGSPEEQMMMQQGAPQDMGMGMPPMGIPGMAKYGGKVNKFQYGRKTRPLTTTAGLMFDSEYGTSAGLLPYVGFQKDLSTGAQARNFYAPGPHHNIHGSLYTGRFGKGPGKPGMGIGANLGYDYYWMQPARDSIYNIPFSAKLESDIGWDTERGGYTSLEATPEFYLRNRHDKLSVGVPINLSLQQNSPHGTAHYDVFGQKKLGARAGLGLEAAYEWTPKKSDNPIRAYLRGDWDVPKGFWNVPEDQKHEIDSQGAHSGGFDDPNPNYNKTPWGFAPRVQAGVEYTFPTGRAIRKHQFKKQQEKKDKSIFDNFNPPVIDGGNTTLPPIEIEKRRTLFPTKTPEYTVPQPSWYGNKQVFSDDMFKYGGRKNIHQINPHMRNKGDGIYIYDGKRYKRQNGKWFKEIKADSGNFVPLTKGDVKKRSAVLDKEAQLSRHSFPLHLQVFDEKGMPIKGAQIDTSGYSSDTAKGLRTDELYPMFLHNRGAISPTLVNQKLHQYDIDYILRQKLDEDEGTEDKPISIFRDEWEKYRKGPYRPTSTLPLKNGGNIHQYNPNMLNASLYTPATYPDFEDTPAGKYMQESLGIFNTPVTVDNNKDDIDTNVFHNNYLNTVMGGGSWQQDWQERERLRLIDDARQRLKDKNKDLTPEEKEELRKLIQDEIKLTEVEDFETKQSWPNYLAQMAPMAANLGMGLFGKTGSLDLDRLSPIELERMNANRELAELGYDIAGTRNKLKNASRGNYGSYVASLQNLFNLGQKQRGRIHKAVRDANIGIEAREDMANLDVQKTNLAQQTAEEMFKAQAEAAKTRMLAEGIKNVADFARTQELDDLASVYNTMFSDKYNFKYLNPWEKEQEGDKENKG